MKLCGDSAVLGRVRECPQNAGGARVDRNPVEAVCGNCSSGRTTRVSAICKTITDEVPSLASTQFGSAIARQQLRLQQLASRMTGRSESEANPAAPESWHLWAVLRTQHA